MAPRAIGPAAPRALLAISASCARRSLAWSSMQQLRPGSPPSHGFASGSTPAGSQPPASPNSISSIEKSRRLAAKQALKQALKDKETAEHKAKPWLSAERRPNPGERKEFRKRIQLSNNSALLVKDSKVLGPDTMATAASAPSVVAIPDTMLDQLRVLEAFKTTQTWNFFRRPHFLVRSETVQLIGLMNESVDKHEGLRCVLTGRRLTGKSMALLQAMCHAFANEWVVIYIPEGQFLTNGNTEYSPIPNTTPLQFTQPVYMLNFVRKILKANHGILEKLQLQEDWSRISHVPPGASLADLILGLRDSDLAWRVLSALWTELTLPGRPPILLGLDGLSHINKVSAYRDPSFNPVHAHDLAVVRLFVDALSGTTKLPNGGAIIAATSQNNAHRHPSQELALAQLEARQAGHDVPRLDPYKRGYDERVYTSLMNCHALRLQGLSHDETRVLLEYWSASGLFKDVVNARTITEKWTLGGHGNIGEIERATLMTLIA